MTDQCETWPGPLPHPLERPWLPVAEAGWRTAGLGRSASYAAVERGELPAIRVGRKIVVPTASIWALLGLDPNNSPPSDGVDVDEAVRARVVALDERRPGP